MTNEDLSRELLARLDERTNYISNCIEKLSDSMAERDKQIEKEYVKREEFIPVKTLVYGFVGLILLSFVGVLITLTFKTTSSTPHAPEISIPLGK